MEPFLALSRFLYVCGFLLIPVSFGLVLVLRRYWSRRYDAAGEATNPEETLAELKREFTPVRRTTIRTQTEYLPFLFESIRENIDSGFEDAQVISLLERIANHRPGEELCASFTVVSHDRTSNLHLRWVRDEADRILLRIQGAPLVIRALKEHQRRIPRAAGNLALRAGWP